jgi:hypothetical protein
MLISKHQKSSKQQRAHKLWKSFLERRITPLERKSGTGTAETEFYTYY